SGFIAGGALMGVVSAALRFAGLNLETEMNESIKQALGLIMYLLLILYLTYSSIRVTKRNN
ncbi:MAG: hypothetical protein IJ338_04200, partial [Bacteroidaceae bacterium]|nr:hypothetical protein [Bacteroidaceae bacterium]